MEIRGAIVVVTGASSGFGERTALRFARAGSSVVLAARRLERLEALAERIAAHGGRALAVRCDVTVPGDIERLRDSTLEILERCDVLVNNAGIAGGGEFRDVDVEQLDRVIATNLTGLVLCTKAFLPSMLERRRGHIVNVASLAGRFAPPGAAVYAATKHGVVAFSESLYHELHGTGVLVTSVNPGFSPTEGFPMRGTPTPILLDPDRVARTIVDVVRRGRAPEISIPRTLAAFQVFRVLTPPLYRWGMGTIARRFGRPRPPAA
ncbi:MAG TPA: SDR family NAD(P)-dependent oxidoreductase [Actinomycetota bacterium]|jgi:short-subunit dehydrogenase|nr:SDR family NAD(P)-dependent oxidoreductase [Actinomycetota bacterium]